MTSGKKEMDKKMSFLEYGTKSFTKKLAVSNEIEEDPSSSNNHAKAPSIGLGGGKRPSAVQSKQPMEIEAESSCDTAISAAALLAVRMNWIQLLKQLEGLNTSISGVSKSVPEATNGVKKIPLCPYRTIWKMPIYTLSS